MNGLKMKYFVLKPAGIGIHAVASRSAMRTYAKMIRHSDVELSDQLRKWADHEQGEHPAFEELTLQEPSPTKTDETVNPLENKR